MPPKFNSSRIGSMTAPRTIKGSGQLPVACRVGTAHHFPLWRRQISLVGSTAQFLSPLLSAAYKSSHVHSPSQYIASKELVAFLG
jgi:hypothetical protein